MTPRRGFSLVELIVALAILGGALLALARFTVQFARANANARVSIAADDLIAAQLERSKTAGTYAAIDSLYQGTEPVVTGHPGFSRSTMVRRVGGTPPDTVDFKVVTVTVAHPALSRPVARSVIIAAY